MLMFKSDVQEFSKLVHRVANDVTGTNLKSILKNYNKLIVTDLQK